ncbi:RDD family protein [Kitasatospora sp. NPDC056446]|uniref:RDD family protein n=1 Tax=Kitasatospora sp. NPDC056446 TaxID=3345819 RepID=UPI003695099B
MTDRPFADGDDPAVAPEPGYYPDPSIPGFVRYWGGAAWVPGTSRPAPAEGEVLVPPRYATRRAAPGGAGGSGGPGGAGGAGRPSARAVRPPVVPAAGVPSTGVPSAAGAVPVRGQASAQASAPVQVQASVPEVERPAGPAGGGDTGPVYFDQTSGGASFVLGPRVAEVIGGPVFRTVGPAVGVAAPAAVVDEPAVGGAVIGGSVLGGAGLGGLSDEAPGESGWQVDPRAQRGLMDTGDAPRWVSWGVLPEASEAEEGRAEPECAPVAVEPAAAAPARAVVVREAVAREAPAPSVEASGAVPVIALPAAVGKADAEAAEPVEAEVESAPGEVGPVVSGASAGPAAPVAVAAVPATPLPAVRSARHTAVRRRPSAAPAAVPAGLGRRLAARAVDTAVLLVVAVAAGIPLGRSVSDHLQQKLAQARMTSALTRRQVQVWLVDDVVLGKLAVLIGILLFVSLLYEVLPIARTGQTFGKRLARIRVVDAAAPDAAPAAARTRLSLGRSLLRWAVRQLGAVLLLGLIWPVLDRPARRGWQDRAARTRVVRG